jgi:hypothetical protein
VVKSVALVLLVAERDAVPPPGGSDIVGEVTQLHQSETRDFSPCP